MPARPARRDQQSHRLQVPFSTVSREIERRIPTAAKLMMSDDPPALMNGSVIPVIGSSATTTPMLMNAWRQSQAVIPAASSAPNVSGADERDPDPGIRQEQEQGDDDDRPDQPELLADVGEDEVVEGVRQEDRWLSPEPGPEQAAEPEREQPLDGVEAVAEPVAPRVEPGADRGSSW